VKLEKLPDGLFNKALLLTMGDGRWTGGGGEDSESQRWAGGIDGGE
jgi:hypothetical protein